MEFAIEVLVPRLFAGFGRCTYKCRTENKKIVRTCVYHDNNRKHIGPLPLSLPEDNSSSTIHTRHFSGAI